MTVESDDDKIVYRYPDKEYDGLDYNLVRENIEEGILPEWYIVFYDICVVFRENKRNSVLDMFEQMNISYSRLNDIVQMRWDRLPRWRLASEDFYSRFGRDYTLSEYDVTCGDDLNGVSDQWYLSTLTELLVMNFTDRKTSSEWVPSLREDIGEDEDRKMVIKVVGEYNE